MHALRLLHAAPPVSPPPPIRIACASIIAAAILACLPAAVRAQAAPAKAGAAVAELTTTDITTIADFRADRASFLGVTLGMTLEQVQAALSARPDVLAVHDRDSPQLIRLYIYAKQPDGSRGPSLGACVWKPDDVRLTSIVLFQDAERLVLGRTKSLLSAEVLDPASPARAFLGPLSPARKSSSGESTLYTSRWIAAGWSKIGDRTTFNISLDFLELPPKRPSDLPAGVRDLMASAAAGQARSQFLLGSWYESRMDDDATAAKWYRAAADQGVADAQFRLGVLYTYGRGLAKSDADAAKWHAAAARQGHSGAQAALAALYKAGLGVEWSLTEAARWYWQSAEQGQVAAQHALAELYAAGHGVPRDAVSSYIWEHVSMLSSQHAVMTAFTPDSRVNIMLDQRLIAGAVKSLLQKEAGLGADQVRAAKRMAAGWRAQPWPSVQQAAPFQTFRTPAAPTTAMGRALAHSLDTTELAILIYLPDDAMKQEAQLTDRLNARFKTLGVPARTFVHPSAGTSPTFAYFLGGRLIKDAEDNTFLPVSGAAAAFDALATLYKSGQP